MLQLRLLYLIFVIKRYYRLSCEFIFVENFYNLKLILNLSKIKINFRMSKILMYSDKKWEQSITDWVQQAYRNQCYLVYAIGSKKQKFLDRLGKVIDKSKKQNKNKQLRGDNGMEQHLLSIQDELPLRQIKSKDKGKFSEQVMKLFDERNIKINQVFEQFQLKHFLQSAKQKVSYEIKNIFVNIHDDRQKLTRSSIARGMKVDNNILDQYMNKMSLKQSIQNKNYYSIRQEDEQFQTNNHLKSKCQKNIKQDEREQYQHNNIKQFKEKQRILRNSSVNNSQ